MRPHRFLSAALFSVALLGGSAVAASAHQTDDWFEGGADHAVFVQSNDPTANQVLAYHRADDGSLKLVGTYPTGGKGGRLNGSVVDPLASQHSLAYDRKHATLIGVNAAATPWSTPSASTATACPSEPFYRPGERSQSASPCMAIWRMSWMPVELEPSRAIASTTDVCCLRSTPTVRWA